MRLAQSRFVLILICSGCVKATVASQFSSPEPIPIYSRVMVWASSANDLGSQRSLESQIAASLRESLAADRGTLGKCETRDRGSLNPSVQSRICQEGNRENYDLPTLVQANSVVFRGKQYEPKELAALLQSRRIEAVLYFSLAGQFSLDGQQRSTRRAYVARLFDVRTAEFRWYAEFDLEGGFGSPTTQQKQFLKKFTDELSKRAVEDGAVQLVPKDYSPSYTAEEDVLLPSVSAATSASLEPMRINRTELNPSADENPISKARAGVIGIRGRSGSGSGIVISSRGLALTNFHVIEGELEGQVEAVLPDGGSFPVTVMRYDEAADIALVRISCPSDCTTVDLSAEDPEIGSEVYVIGTPVSAALSQSVTRGIVSGIREAGELTYLQTDAAANPGNSGGPIVDATTGMVIGVLTLKIVAENIEGISFGLSIHDALERLKIEYPSLTSEPPSVTSAPVANLDGAWQFSEILKSDTHEIGCNTSGSVTLTQAGASFSGTTQVQSTCFGPEGSFDNSGERAITGGQINGDTVTFQIPFCSYRGRIIGSPAVRITGTGTCTVQMAGQPVEFQAEWQAGKQIGG